MCCFILTLFPDKQQGIKLLHKQDSTKPTPIWIHAAIPKMSSSWVKVVGLGVCKLAEFFLVPSKLHSCWGLASSLLLTAVSEALGELWLHAALSRCHNGSANAPPISRLACPKGMKAPPFCHLVALIYMLLTRKGMQTHSKAQWKENWNSLITVVILPQGRAPAHSYDTYLGSLPIKVRSC